MVSAEIKATVQIPDNLSVNLVREDYLSTSNSFRIFFEICLAIAGALFGDIISILNDSKPVPGIYWVFFSLTILGCFTFVFFAVKNFNKAKLGS